MSSNSHPFDNEFILTDEQKERYQRDGFVKLDGFLNPSVVSTLLDRVDAEMGRSGGPATLRTNSMFSRVTYDFDHDKAEVFEMMSRPYFRQAMTELIGEDLFLTFELCFELEKNVSKGFPWHVGAQSFGYQHLEDEGITLWAPLHPIDASGQRGGMGYVPEHVISGNFIYSHVDPAIVSTFRAKEQAGIRTTVGEYFETRRAILNAPPMCDILETHQVEDDFQPGDVLVFNKMVVHRSIMLGEGELPRRAAYVMRFVNAGARYDLARVQNIEFPVEQYGQGLFAYRPFTRQHIEIAEAGAVDGSLLAECAYFDNRDRRLLRS